MTAASAGKEDSDAPAARDRSAHAPGDRRFARGHARLQPAAGALHRPARLRRPPHRPRRAGSLLAARQEDVPGHRPRPAARRVLFHARASRAGLHVERLFGQAQPSLHLPRRRADRHAGESSGRPRVRGRGDDRARSRAGAQRVLQPRRGRVAGIRAPLRHGAGREQPQRSALGLAVARGDGSGDSVPGPGHRLHVGPPRRRLRIPAEGLCRPAQGGERSRRRRPRALRRVRQPARRRRRGIPARSQPGRGDGRRSCAAGADGPHHPQRRARPADRASQVHRADAQRPGRSAAHRLDQLLARRFLRPVERRARRERRADRRQLPAAVERHLGQPRPRHAQAATARAQSDSRRATSAAAPRSCAAATARHRHLGDLQPAAGPRRAELVRAPGDDRQRRADDDVRVRHAGAVQGRLSQRPRQAALRAARQADPERHARRRSSRRRSPR